VWCLDKGEEVYILRADSALSVISNSKILMGAFLNFAVFQRRDSQHDTQRHCRT
jgi:hypothetical protein